MFCSGPVDDGKTVDGPRHATMKAIVQGINQVRRELSLNCWNESIFESIDF